MSIGSHSSQYIGSSSSLSHLHNSQQYCISHSSQNQPIASHSLHGQSSSSMSLMSFTTFVSYLLVLHLFNLINVPVYRPLFIHNAQAFFPIVHRVKRARPAIATVLLAVLFQHSCRAFQLFNRIFHVVRLTFSGQSSRLSHSVLASQRTAVPLPVFPVL